MSSCRRYSTSAASACATSSGSPLIPTDSAVSLTVSLGQTLPPATGTSVMAMAQALRGRKAAEVLAQCCRRGRSESAVSLRSSRRRAQTIVGGQKGSSAGLEARLALRLSEIDAVHGPLRSLRQSSFPYAHPCPSCSANCVQEPPAFRAELRAHVSATMHASISLECSQSQLSVLFAS